jgi:hypothetical protein
MAKEYIIVNLEEGRPTAEAALRRLFGEIHRARANQVKVIKLIHGYGSSGTGGVLRVAVRKELERLRKKGLVKIFIPGESFDIFSADTIKLLDACRLLRDDRDLGRYNNGITMVML